MAETIIYAMYDDDDILKDGAKKLVSKGVKITEVFSPFPIHGIDPIIGVKDTRLGIMAFLYGLTGTVLATIGMRYDDCRLANEHWWKTKLLLFRKHLVIYTCNF